MVGMATIALSAVRGLDRSTCGRSRFSGAVAGQPVVTLSTSPLGREFGARAVIVDAIDDQAAAFYLQYDFHAPGDRRLWGRLADIAGAVGE
jgi:hypothetical protein